MPPFFDTNILVYLVDEDEPEKQRIARSLVEAHLTEGDGVISVQVLREFYWVAKRLDHPLSEERARQAVNDFAQFVSVSEDADIVLRAVRRHREMSLSFWDALIIEAALKAGADRLLTEDMQHGQIIEGMRVENPFL